MVVGCLRILIELIVLVWMNEILVAAMLMLPPIVSHFVQKKTK